MAEEKTARKKQGGGTLPKLLLLALLLLIGAHLLNLRQEISRAEAEKQTLSAQLEQQQRENDSLSSALEKADDPEYLQELAREQLDMVSPGEKVFYDVSNYSSRRGGASAPHLLLFPVSGCTENGGNVPPFSFF